MTPRTEPPWVAGEREQLTGFLDFLREAVVVKATGLTDEQARQQLVPSELTTVAGLVAHLTYVEQYWFGVLFDGRPDEWRERFAADPDAEFRAGMTTPLTELVESYVKECARSRAVAENLDLEATATRGGEPVNLRWVLIHMIEETGRHAGHLDLLRELLDGSTGE
ncbi:DinB family protein [Actinophytocola sp. NPDC049390]|uniref:DinB family protein n=1 Tax=Actinophytocola sp. NPDC049390 TaxID=3363894 RepID=UPI00379C3E61